METWKDLIKYAGPYVPTSFPFADGLRLVTNVGKLVLVETYCIHCRKGCDGFVNGRVGGPATKQGNMLTSER